MTTVGFLHGRDRRPLQGPAQGDDSLDCTLLLIRTWSGPADLSERIRSALQARPQANVIVLPGLGVLVLAPSMASLQRRTALVQDLILLAAGGRPAVSSTRTEARGKQPHSTCELTK